MSKIRVGIIGEEALVAQKMLDGIFESSEKGREVSLTG